MLDANIPLQVQAPQIASPLTNISALMGVRDSLSQIALRQAQVQQANEAAAENQALAAQHNKELADQNAFQEITKDPGNAYKIFSGDFSPAYGKVSAEYIDKQRTAVEEALDKHATRTTTQLAQEQTAHANIGKTLDALQALVGPNGEVDKVNAALPGALDGLAPDLKILSDHGHLDISKLPSTVSSADDLTRMAAGAGALSGMTDAALARAKEKAATKASEASAASSQAEADTKVAQLPGVKAKTSEEQQIAGFQAVHGGLTPEQQKLAEQAAAVEAETQRHNKKTEQVASAEEGLKAKENAAKFGGDMAKGWAETIKQNPDAVSEVPADLKNSVMKEFTTSTGLPFPKPLTGQTATQEVAARNALDGAAFIEKALANPEIRKQIGPIMGRLGNAEQSVGTAVGLSPEAERQAQELRTRMRYFVFQEGKAILGGRLPQKLMDELSASSGNIKMDPNMLQGAVNGAKDNAMSVLDNADKERFGGQMRSREQRGLPASSAAPSGGYKAGDTRVINGVTYHRDDKGNWNPQ